MESFLKYAQRELREIVVERNGHRTVVHEFSDDDVRLFLQFLAYPVSATLDSLEADVERGFRDFRALGPHASEEHRRETQFHGVKLFCLRLEALIRKVAFVALQNHGLDYWAPAPGHRGLRDSDLADLMGGCFSSSPVTAPRVPIPHLRISKFLTDRINQLRIDVRLDAAHQAESADGYTDQEILELGKAALQCMLAVIKENAAEIRKAIWSPRVPAAYLEYFAAKDDARYFTLLGDTFQPNPAADLLPLYDDEAAPDLGPADDPIEGLPVAEILARSKRNRFIIIGDPGAGKTTTLRKLRATLCKEILERRRQLPVPVLISAKDYDPASNWNFRQLLHRALNEPPTMNLALAQVDALLAEGHLLPLIDGINEVGARYTHDAIQEIARWLDNYPRSGFVLATRVHSFRDAFGLPTYLLQKIPPARIGEFVALYLPDASQAAALTAEIDRHPELKSLAQNPLYLRMLCGLAGAGRIETRSRGELFKNIIAEKIRREVQTNRQAGADQWLSPLSNFAYDLRSRGEMAVGEAQARAFFAPANAGGGDVFAKLVENKLLENRDGLVGFFEQEQFLEYFTAEALCTRLEQRDDLPADLVSDPRWEEPLVMATGVLSSTGKHAVRERLLDLVQQNNVSLAASCLASVRSQVREDIAKFTDRLLASIRNPGAKTSPEAKLFAMFHSAPHANAEENAAIEAIVRLGDLDSLRRLLVKAGGMEPDTLLQVVRAMRTNLGTLPFAFLADEPVVKAMLGKSLLADEWFRFALASTVREDAAAVAKLFDAVSGAPVFGLLAALDPAAAADVACRYETEKLEELEAYVRRIAPRHQAAYYQRLATTRDAAPELRRHAIRRLRGDPESAAPLVKLILDEPELLAAEFDVPVSADFRVTVSRAVWLAKLQQLYDAGEFHQHGSAAIAAVHWIPRAMSRKLERQFLDHWGLGYLLQEQADRLLADANERSIVWLIDRLPPQAILRRKDLLGTVATPRSFQSFRRVFGFAREHGFLNEVFRMRDYPWAGAYPTSLGFALEESRFRLRGRMHWVRDDFGFVRIQGLLPELFAHVSQWNAAPPGPLPRPEVEVDFLLGYDWQNRRMQACDITPV